MNTHYAILFRELKAVAALGFPSATLAEAACTGIALVNDDVHFGQVFDIATNQLGFDLEDWRSLYEEDYQADAERDYQVATISARALVAEAAGGK